MPASLAQIREKSNLSSIVPVKNETEKPKFRYIYLSDISNLKSACDAIDGRAYGLLSKWFDGNGISMSTEKTLTKGKKGNLVRESFLYEFDMNKLEKGIGELCARNILTSEQAKYILDKITSSSTNEMPDKAAYKSNDGFVPGMPKEDDGIRHV